MSIEMNAVMIDDLVQYLGRTYPEMISSGMQIPGGPPKGIFDSAFVPTLCRPARIAYNAAAIAGSLTA
ncbi:hypothetical protein ACQKQA_03695 [Pseudomonas sp. NPDC089530]|uniref:hypothetical protein n=1 Tax=Pseudomonas sp. NPDC089530 TaxID=3390651 RepID=UPI003D06C9D8